MDSQEVCDRYARGGLPGREERARLEPGAWRRIFFCSDPLLQFLGTFYNRWRALYIRLSCSRL
jgi:hypothetical protein